MTSAEITAEGTNGNRIAIHAIAIMVDTCSQCNDIRYVLPKPLPGDSYPIFRPTWSGFDIETRVNPTICRNFDVTDCPNLNADYTSLALAYSAGAMTSVASPYLTL